MTKATIRKPSEEKGRPNLFFHCDFANEVRSIISKEMDWVGMDIVSTLFYPLGSHDQGISACMQPVKPLTHRDNVLWHTVQNYASWHIWKARCAADFNNEKVNPHLTAFATLLDVRRAAVNQIGDLHHWERWWAVRPELNFLDKEGLQSEVAWYTSMLSARELALIPTKGLSFERNEKDSLSIVISNHNVRYNSGTYTSKKRRIADVEVASISSDSSEEEPLRRNVKRRRINNTTTMLILGATPGDKSGTAVES